MTYMIANFLYFKIKTIWNGRFLSKIRKYITSHVSNQIRQRKFMNIFHHATCELGVSGIERHIWIKIVSRRVNVSMVCYIFWISWRIDLADNVLASTINLKNNFYFAIC